MTEGGRRAVEASLLGALACSGDLPRALEECGEIGFSFAPHRKIHAALTRLVERGIRDGGLVALAAELESAGDLDIVGGASELAKLADECPNIEGHAFYANELRRLLRRSEAVAVAERIALKMRTGEPLDGELDLLKRISEGEEEEERKNLPEPLPAPRLLDDLTGATDWIFEPLFMRGGITQIQGAPKGGKSSFSLYASLSIAYGRWDAGRFSAPAASRKVLFVSYEDGLNRLKRRLMAYARGLGLPALPEDLLLFAQPPMLFFPRDLAAWTAIVKACRADLVVFDTAAYVHTGDENKASDMAPVMCAIKRLSQDASCAIALVHHTRKPGTGGDVAETSERGRGSSMIAGAHDIILDWGRRTKPNVTACRLVSKESEGEDGEWSIEYKAEKNDDDELVVTWKVENLYEREDVAQTKQKVRTALEKLPNGATKNELSEKSGIPRKTLDRYLVAMRAEFDVSEEEKSHRKRYQMKKSVDISNIRPNK